jgi:MFS family permease
MLTTSQESSLYFAKAATVYQWGRLSDKLGRRPILLMGPLGLGLSTCALGATNNAWVQTTARSLQGVFGGNLGELFWLSQ